MPLQGSLPDFDVVDVLQLLRAAGKTGVVRFFREQGPAAQSGAIYFRDGRPVAAETDGMVGEGALEMLCSWDSGGFVYREGATSPRENLDLPAPVLMERASAATEEWREIRRVLPLPTASARVVSELPPGVEEVRLSRDEWALLAGMIRAESVSAWTRKAGGGLPAYRTMRKLAESGLLEVEGEEARA